MASVLVLFIGCLVGCGDGPKDTEVKPTTNKEDPRLERAGKPVESQGTHKKAELKEK